jgi:F-type H+-transporting ATPase subunit a
LEKTRKWRYGVNRWIVLALIILNIIAVQFFPPIAPHIQVAPEKLSTTPLFTLPVIGDFYLANTLVASILVMVIPVVMAYFINRAIKRGDLVPRGFAGALEALIEGLYNLTESTAGKWAKWIFPFFTTIFLAVLVANWMEMFPGVDSIGWLHHVDHGGFERQELVNGVYTITGKELESGGYQVVPWVRVASTDLNFTLMLALVSVVFTQVIGLKAKGPAYLFKFFDVRTLFSRPGFGLMDFLVSLLELISEFSRILSFTFRLFGNIFAGMVLLILIGTLVPVLVQSGVLLFEFFIGLIQALVFGMLTMVFMSMATQGHGGEQEAEH